MPFHNKLSKKFGLDTVEGKAGLGVGLAQLGVALNDPDSVGGRLSAQLLESNRSLLQNEILSQFSPLEIDTATSLTAPLSGAKQEAQTTPFGAASTNLSQIDQARRGGAPVSITPQALGATAESTGPPLGEPSLAPQGATTLQPPAIKPINAFFLGRSRVSELSGQLIQLQESQIAFQQQQDEQMQKFAEQNAKNQEKRDFELFEIQAKEESDIRTGVTAGRAARTQDVLNTTPTRGQFEEDRQSILDQRAASTSRDLAASGAGAGQKFGIPTPELKLIQEANENNEESFMAPVREQFTGLVSGTPEAIRAAQSNVENANTGSAIELFNNQGISAQTLKIQTGLDVGDGGEIIFDDQKQLNDVTSFIPDGTKISINGILFTLSGGSLIQSRN